MNDTLKEIRTGGCSCGAVRFQTTSEPMRVSVCHCKDCQQRTGSTFGVGCYFPKDNVTILQGKMKSYQRDSDAGRKVTNLFCDQCGTTLMWNLEVLPQATGIAGGTFDNTDWISPRIHVWVKSAQKWTTIPDDVEKLQQSNISQLAKNH